ncbi:MAG: bifunctional UDP-sugar hydrolase/5'-nucleotidase [Kiritimatiellia bacterium]
MAASVQRLRAAARRFFVGAAVACAAQAAEARLVEIVVLNTTDLHGAICRSPGVYAERNDGSLLQCATLVRRERAKTPGLLLLDCGDIIQGTAASYQTRGGIMATAMNAMGYDAYVPGNHEFDWGLDALAGYMEQMQAPALAANLVAGPEAPAAFRRTLPYLIKEIDGVRVAIVGLTNPNIPNWTRGTAEAGLDFLDSRRALEQILPEVRREKPHVMILLVHQGYLQRDDAANQLNAIGRRFGEFDLMLGGHLHAVSTRTQIGKLTYGQAGAGAQGVLRVALTFDTVKNAVTAKQIEFLPVEPDLPEDPDIYAQVAADLARADEWLGTVIGRTRSELVASIALPGLCSVQQLICVAIAEKTGADAVLHDILSPNDVPAGEFRVADAWKIVPYENTAGVLRLTPGEIRGILEESTAYLGTERYFGAWGLRYELHPKAPPGRRIRQLRAADGSPINGKKRLRVAFNSYHLSGGGGRFPAIAKAAADPRCRLEPVAEPVRDLVIDYVRRHRTIDVPAGTNAVVVLKEPRAWRRRK